MTDRAARIALAIGVALLLAGIGCSLLGALAIERRRVFESDCETLYRARESACRAVTAFGAICHDATVWRRDAP